MSDASSPSVLPRWWNTKIVVSMVVLVAGIVFTVLAIRLPLWQRGQPASGLFPQVLGFGWVLFAAVNLVIDVLSVTRAKDAVVATGSDPELVDPFAEDPSRIEPRTVLWLMGLTVLYVVVFEWVGAILSSVLFGIAATFILKSSGRRATIIAVVLVPIIMVVAIQYLLKQELPAGILGFLPFL